VTSRTQPSAKLVAYSSIGLVLLLAGVLVARVEAAEIGMAFLAAAVVGLAMARAPRYDVTARIERDAVMEGDPATVHIAVRAETAVPWISVTLPTPLGMSRDATTSTDAIQIEAGDTHVLSVQLTPRRWGIFRVGPVVARTHDSLGFFTYESRFAEQPMLRVFPREELLARAIRPADTQLWSGDEVARRKGDGIEFADVRPFEPGDRVRRINWAVSTRLQKLHVNEVHPERNADVVIFLDSFSDIGDHSDTTLLMAVRAAAASARHYLRRRDRVSLVNFGGTVRWQLPGMGLRQAYRIVDALLSTDRILSYAWKGIDVIPAQTLPPRALVIAITPLLDERTTSALLDLRGRGFDLVIVEVSPLPFVSIARSEEDGLAYRLWLMKREGMRHEYWRAGVPVTQWKQGLPLVAALQEVEQFRRFGRNLRIS